jgi:Uma2 family endonuclease
MTPTTFTGLQAASDVFVPRTSGAPHLPTAPDGRVRFTREAYHRMAEAGLLAEDVRYELIEGEIYMMSPIGPLEGGLISRLMDFFVTRLPAHLKCRVQLSMAIGESSEPEPDLAIVRVRDDDYFHAIPAENDVVMLIEVADSSLSIDLGKKLRLYSEARISEYWVVNAQNRSIIVHRQPVGSEYRDTQELSVGSSIAPLAAPECKLDITWLFR